MLLNSLDYATIDINASQNFFLTCNKSYGFKSYICYIFVYNL